MGDLTTRIRDTSRQNNWAVTIFEDMRVRITWLPTTLRAAQGFISPYPATDCMHISKPHLALARDFQDVMVQQYNTTKPQVSAE